MRNELAILFDEVRFLETSIKTLNDHPKDSGNAAGVLQVLGEGGPQTVPQLARFRITSRQNMQLIINRLVKAGYLEMLSNPAHKRSDLFQLTASGRTLLAAIIERENHFLEELAPQISNNDLHLACAVLRRLRELISERNGSPKNLPGEIGSNRPNIQSEGDELPVSLL